MLTYRALDLRRPLPLEACVRSG